MKFEFTKGNIILLTLFIFIVIVGLNMSNYKAPEIIKAEKIVKVKDYSRFFTISNAGSKYINYLKNQDKDNLIKLLNDTYINTNNITKDNVLDKLELLPLGEYSFSAKDMKEERLSKNMMRYYVYGSLNEEIINEADIKTDYYLIIEIDLNNNTFAVTPYNGAIFKEEL